jgi:hypothetical protein
MTSGRRSWSFEIWGSTKGRSTVWWVRRVSGGSSSSRRTTASTGRQGSMGKPWFRYWATSALTRAPVVVRWTFLIGGLRLDTTGFLARKGAATPGDADRDRGASSKRDAGRLMRTVTAISAAEVEGWGVPSEFQRALVADVQKMTQAEDHNVQLSPDCIRHELPTRVFNVKGVYRFGAQPATVCRTQLRLVAGSRLWPETRVRLWPVRVLATQRGCFFRGHRCGYWCEKTNPRRCFGLSHRDRRNGYEPCS